MADSKISQLTSATTPLAGTEVLPIVQSGATKQVSVSDFTAGRNFSAGTITANIIVPTVAEFPDGTAAAPSITNTGDTDTGMYFPAANAVSLVTAGVNRLRINSAGDVGIGTITPGARLDVRGSATFNEDGANVDFRVEGDTDANLFFVDASADFVGIGTNAPTQKLTVAGTITTTQGNTITSNNLAGNAFSLVSNSDATAGSSSSVLLWNNNGLSASSAALSFFSTASSVPNELRLSNGAAAPITFYTNGSERVRIDSSGNVGIGTATPASKLDVNGTITATGFSVSTLTVTGNTYLATTSGDVGIGTTSPANKLHVTGTGSTPTLFERTGSNGVYLQLKDASGASVFLGADNGLFAVQTPGSSYSNKLVVDSSGNVGIGTSSPATKLDVVGSLGIRVNEDGAGTKVIQIRSNYAGLGPSVQVSTADPLLFLTNNTERMRITSAGDVGIGTTSPGAKLEVAGNVNITGNTTLGDASTDTVQVNGYMGVGGAANSAIAILASNTALGSSTQHGVYSLITGTSAATSLISGFTSLPATAAASFTVADVYGYRASNATKGAGSTITNLHGLYIADQTQGTNNYGITSLVSSGSNKWNIYASGTAANYFAGKALVGTTTDQDGRLIIRSTGNTYANSAVAIVDSVNTTKLQMLQTTSGFFYMTVNGTDDFVLKATETVFNESGADIDFRVESDTNTHALFVEGSSGNVGIGTSSPTTKLHVNTGAAGYGITVAASSQTSITYQFGIDSSSNLAIYDSFAAAKRLVLNAAGNLGLGVTPSAWASSFKAMQLGAGGSVSGRTNTDEVYVSANAYFDTTDNRWEYIATDVATQYYQDAGTHVWRTASSGTAGDAISFTQAMKLDASGNLLVGTTTGVASGTGVAIYSPTASRLQLRNSTTGDTASDGCGLLAFGADLYVENRENGATLFFNNGSERARITSAGDVGIGTASPVGKLGVAGSQTVGFNAGLTGSPEAGNLFYTTDGTGWQFRIGKYQSGAFTSQMVFTDAGNVLIGKTASTYSAANRTCLEVAGASNAVFELKGGTSSHYIYNDGTNWQQVVTNAGYQSFYTNNLERMRIDSSGNLGVGIAAPSTKLHVSGGVLRTNTRVTNSQNYPLGHYSPGECVFEVDPTWTEAELQAFFQTSAVTWAAVADAPGGYCIYIDGAVNVGGVYNSGFPYIPVDTSDVYYMECWIQNVGSNQGHYMGSIDYDQNFASLGGNPGSFGYWVMSNTDPGNTWTKVSGYIQGFGTATSQFVAGTKYWTPQALFNYTPGTGTRACRISGWKVIRAYQPGNRFFSGNVGIGQSSPALQSGGTGITLYGSSASEIKFLNSTTGSSASDGTALVTSGADFVINNREAGAVTFGTSNTERMRVTSAGNVGIGTASPLDRLEVSGGNIYLGYATTTTQENALLGFLKTDQFTANGLSIPAYGLKWGTISGGAVGLHMSGYGGVLLYSGNTERMRLDSAGNLGLGVTPSAASLPTIQSAYGLFTGNVEAHVNKNAYYNSGWKYVNTAPAARYSVGEGDSGYRWYQAGTGTAGNAISFTQAMTLDASGNLLLGSSSTLGYRSQIFSATNGYTQALVQISAFNSGNLAGTVYSGYYDGSNITDMASIRGGKENTTSGNFGGMLAFYTRPNGGSDTERARITSGGDLLVGTTANTESAKLNVQGGYIFLKETNGGDVYLRSAFGSGTDPAIQVASNDPLLFATNNTERMRINSSGDLLVGTATSLGKLTVSGGNVFFGNNTAGSATALVSNGDATAGSSAGLLLWNNNGFSATSGSLYFYSSTSAVPNELRMANGGAAPITFYTNGSEQMRILSDGKVGIGTASPATALDVNGKVTSTGFITGALYDSAFKRFTNPGGGIYTTGSSSLTGAIKITFPVGLTNTMVKLTVKVYEYATNESFEIHLGGYAYSVGPTWANNPYAYIVGNPTINRQFTVRLGYDGTKAVAYIGELASTWSYPQIYITEVQCGYGGFSESYASGWTIGFEASAFQNVTATISNPQVGYQAVAGDAIQGSVRYTSTTRTAGCFYGGTTTPTGSTRLNYSGYLYPTFLNLAGSADTTTTATHYFVETGSDGFVRPKTLANVQTEIVTSAAVSAALGGAIAFGSGTAAAPSIYPTGDTNTGFFFPAADTIGMSTGGVERVRVVDSAVGIGIVPSARSANFYGLQVGYASLEGTTTQPDAWLSANARYDSSWKYIASNFASMYEQTAGRHSFYTTTSGTAGNAITFSEVFRVGADKHVYTQGGSDKGYKSSSDVAWTSFTLQNSYTQNTTTPFQYRRVGNMVEIHGIFEKTAGCGFAEVVAALPSGLRPTDFMYVVGTSFSDNAPLGLATTFEIAPASGNIFISLPLASGANYKGGFSVTFTCIS